MLLNYKLYNSSLFNKELKSEASGSNKVPSIESITYLMKGLNKFYGKKIPFILSDPIMCDLDIIEKWDTVEFKLATTFCSRYNKILLNLIEQDPSEDSSFNEASTSILRDLQELLDSGFIFYEAGNLCEYSEDECDSFFLNHEVIKHLSNSRDQKLYTQMKLLRKVGSEVDDVSMAYISQPSCDRFPLKKTVNRMKTSKSFNDSSNIPSNMGRGYDSFSNSDDTGSLGDLLCNGIPSWDLTRLENYYEMGYSIDDVKLMKNMTEAEVKEFIRSNGPSNLK